MQSEISIILIIVGSLAFIEGLMLYTFPKEIKKMLMQINKLKKLGLLEMFIAILFVIAGFLLSNYKW